MELKFVFPAAITLKFGCSNRTFMELKFLTLLLRTILTLVLIVPLWN